MDAGALGVHRSRGRTRGCARLQRLLGNPDHIQGDLQGLSADVAGTQDANGWRLLLQVDSDLAATGMEWGDEGRLYWMIRHEDLVAARFDRTVLHAQCY